MARFFPMNRTDFDTLFPEAQTNPFSNGILTKLIPISNNDITYELDSSNQMDNGMYYLYRSNMWHDINHPLYMDDYNGLNKYQGLFTNGLTKEIDINDDIIVNKTIQIQGFDNILSSFDDQNNVFFDFSEIISSSLDIPYATLQITAKSVNSDFEILVDILFNITK